MKVRKSPYAGIAMATAILYVGATAVNAASVGASYFSMSPSDPDVANNQGTGSLVTTVGAGLGPNGLPVVNTSVSAGAQLHDVNSVTHELEWWSPSMDSHVTVLNNPVYSPTITLPFTDNNMYTNTTVLGANGNDSSSFLTAKFTGLFTIASTASVNFNVCSDDDEFVYLSGGAFGGGTLVVDNGGIHALSCSSGNVNTSMLTDVAAGNYTLTVFYDDREQSGAAFQFSSTLSLAPPTPTPTAAPEPATFGLLVLGFGGGALALFRKRRLSS